MSTNQVSVRLQSVKWRNLWSGGCTITINPDDILEALKPYVQIDEPAFYLSGFTLISRLIVDITGIQPESKLLFQLTNEFEISKLGIKYKIHNSDHVDRRSLILMTFKYSKYIEYNSFIIP
jgi:hypothetical protein